MDKDKFVDEFNELADKISEKTINSLNESLEDAFSSIGRTNRNVAALYSLVLTKITFSNFATYGYLFLEVGESLDKKDRSYFMRDYAVPLFREFKEICLEKLEQYEKKLIEFDKDEKC